jgi:hypothetical protein
MEIKDLIRLAAKADLEGNFRVADRITEKIETMSREAAFNWQKLFGFGNKGGQNTVNFGDLLDNIDAPKPTGVPRRTGPRPPIETDTTPKPPKPPKPQKPDVDTPVGSEPPVVNPPKPPIVKPPVPPTTPIGSPSSKSLNLRDINQNNIDNSKNYGGLLAAALGAYGMYLMAGKIYDPTGKIVSPDKLPENIKQMFKANQLSMRSQAGQMGNEQAAQDFIEKYRYDPKFKTAQDFYYQAQREGQPQSMMNSIAALAKAEGFTDKTRFVD